ncbi:hypothetical protein BC826DRAFT_972185 [Russula brevipes]|nr:hypothetical protein BC826DRAFT_972185 [Russula brevipes]
MEDPETGPESDDPHAGDAYDNEYDENPRSEESDRATRSDEDDQNFDIDEPQYNDDEGGQDYDPGDAQYEDDDQDFDSDNLQYDESDQDYDPDDAPYYEDDDEPQMEGLYTNEYDEPDDNEPEYLWAMQEREADARPNSPPSKDGDSELYRDTKDSCQEAKEPRVQGTGNTKLVTQHHRTREQPIDAYKQWPAQHANEARRIPPEPPPLWERDHRNPQIDMINETPPQHREVSSCDSQEQHIDWISDNEWDNDQRLIQTDNALRAMNESCSIHWSGTSTRTASQGRNLKLTPFNRQLPDQFEQCVLTWSTQSYDTFTGHSLQTYDLPLGLPCTPTMADASSHPANLDRPATWIYPTTINLLHDGHHLALRATLGHAVSTLPGAQTPDGVPRPPPPAALTSSHAPQDFRPASLTDNGARSSLLPAHPPIPFPLGAHSLAIHATSRGTISFIPTPADPLSRTADTLEDFHSRRRTCPAHPSRSRV